MENIHPIFRDILNSVQNLEKSVDTGLEEQDPSPAEMKEQYIELLKKYNEAETARFNFHGKLYDLRFEQHKLNVFEDAVLGKDEPSKPLLYDIDSLVIE